MCVPYSYVRPNQKASMIDARAQAAPLQLTTTNPTAQELGSATQQKLRVCDICGALLSIFDSNDRLAEQLSRVEVHWYSNWWNV